MKMKMTGRPNELTRVNAKNKCHERCTDIALIYLDQDHVLSLSISKPGGVSSCFAQSIEEAPFLSLTLHLTLQVLSLPRSVSLF